MKETRLFGPKSTKIEGYVCNLNNLYYCDSVSYIGIAHDEKSLKLYNNPIALLTDKNLTLTQNYSVPVYGLEHNHISYGIQQKLPFLTTIENGESNFFEILYIFVTICGMFFLYKMYFCMKQLLKKKEYRNAIYKEQLLNSNCTICLEDFEIDEKVVIIDHCKHIFHRGCFKTWINTKNTCPNCQYEMIA
jgi:hypothetical protein